MENYIIILLCLAAFFAGFIDAVVGGGGLIQTPMGLILLPNLPVSTVVGSLKIPAFSGTSFAAYQYLKKVEMNWKLLSIMMLLAFPSAFLGSTLLTYVSNDFMKPILLVVLSFLVIYTYAKKNFGQQIEKNISQQRQLFNAVSISFIVGLYDGFIGPGTGSFLVVAFIAIMGFDFLYITTLNFFILTFKKWTIAYSKILANRISNYFALNFSIAFLVKSLSTNLPLIAALSANNLSQFSVPSQKTFFNSCIACGLL
jgi:uncharacterized membrane protein YfcA